MLSEAPIASILRGTPAASGDTSLRGMLGGTAAEDPRIYVDEAPEGLARPYLVFTRSDDEVLLGSGGVLDFGAVDYELVVTADDPDEARSVMDKVIEVLGAITDGEYGPAGGLERVQTVFWQGATSEFDDETRYFIRRGSARFWGGG